MVYIGALLPGGLLEEAFVAGKAEELLGKTGAGEWPQARAGAAAEDDGGDVHFAIP